jgi:hypothetical protein
MTKAIKRVKRLLSPRLKRGYAQFEGYWIPTTPLKGVLTPRYLEEIHKFNMRQAEANFLITRGWKPSCEKVIRQAGPLGGTNLLEVYWSAAHVATPIPQTLAVLMERGDSKLL